MNRIELANGSVLHHIKRAASTKLSWIFVPGGPGMGPEYLIALADALNISGSISVFELPTQPNLTIQPGLIH